MSNEKSSTNQTMINVICSIGVMAVNLCISFFLSPYIIRTIGVEANGFVSLANNFTTYANLVVTALNGMATRFITFEYVKKDYKKANLYYNSVFWGNLIIAAVLLLPAAIIVGRLEYFVDVPAEILSDVKALFAFIFTLFFIRTCAPNYDCGTSVANRLDLKYIPNIMTALLRCVLLFCMFTLAGAHVYFVGFTSLVVGVIGLLISGHYTHKLTPQLRVQFKPILNSFKAIKKLVGAGIWNTIALSGNMLLVGLDLLVCNIALGATEMGILSLAKTLPSILTELSDSIRGAFGPELTINYAKGDKEAVERCVTRAMKITTVVVSIVAVGIVIMSDSFFSLWVPSQNAKLLQTLTILAMLNHLIGSNIYILYNVFTTVNKVRYNAFALLTSGIISIFITLVLVTFTDWDLYAVAGVSSIVTIIKNIFFVYPTATKMLGFKWYKFYPQFLISLLCTGINIAVGFVIRMFINPTSWIVFFLTCFLLAGICAVIDIVFVLNKEERAYLYTRLKARIAGK